MYYQIIKKTDQRPYLQDFLTALVIFDLSIYLFLLPLTVTLTDEELTATD